MPIVTKWLLLGSQLYQQRGNQSISNTTKQCHVIQNDGKSFQIMSNNKNNVKFYTMMPNDTTNYVK